MRIIFAALALGVVASPALAANDLIEAYFARLGANDHFNSKGERLTSVAAIIRQDRANYHQFGVRDDEDQGDSVFSDKSNRARLESMIDKGRVSAAARKDIVNGTPLIHVEIYQDHVNVEIR